MTLIDPLLKAHSAPQLEAAPSPPSVSKAMAPVAYALWARPLTSSAAAVFLWFLWGLRVSRFGGGGVQGFGIWGFEVCHSRISVLDFHRICQGYYKSVTKDGCLHVPSIGWLIKEIAYACVC